MARWTSCLMQEILKQGPLKAATAVQKLLKGTRKVMMTVLQDALVKDNDVRMQAMSQSLRNRLFSSWSS